MLSSLLDEGEKNFYGGSEERFQMRGASSKYQVMKSDSVNVTTRMFFLEA